MPLSISDLGKKTRSLTFQYELTPGRSEAVSFTYRPTWMTPARAREHRELLTTLQAAGGDSPDQLLGIEMLANMLANMLVSWDVQGEKGKPYPTTAEALAALDPEFLACVLAAVQNDISPNSTSAVPSGAGSQAMASSAMSPTGTA